MKTSVTYRDVVKKGRGGWRITERVAEHQAT
jgi:hypothetical protein